MDDKVITQADAIISTKRIEFLLEQILINTVGNRYQNLPDKEIKTKIIESLRHVDDDMKSYTQSLKKAK